MTSSNGFIWPVSGPVECPDWDPIVECGYGLHGLLMGVGAAKLLDWSAEARWLVVEIEEFVDLDDKVKFPRGIVIYAGDRRGATQKIIEMGADPAVVPGAVVIAGDRGTATAGQYGTATAGYGGTATAGDYGTATAGRYGTATAGYCGTAIAGHYGTAAAGHYGTAAAGDRGTATAGQYGVATASYRGTAAAGEGGRIQIEWYDDRAERYRIAIGYIGENGLLPNVAYRLDETYEFVAVEK
jgi:hypothetical protein